MRIALVTPEYPGCGPSAGIGRYVQDLAEALALAGHTLLVLAATDAGAFVVHHGKCTWSQALPRRLLQRSLGVRSWLLRELHSFRPEVVEAPNWGALTAFLPPRWPVVVRLSTSAADAGGAQRDPFRLLRVGLESLAVRRADLVVSDSMAMARRAASLYGRTADLVIPHAWNGARPILTPDHDRPPGILFVGRWEPRKGVDLLLQAWQAVRSLYPQAHLHMVGSGQPGQLRLPGVTAHGRLTDHELAVLSLSCRVQVIPSRFESFGIVVLEAWAAGLAVVACRGGALDEVVSPAGLVVDHTSTQLAQGLLSALAAPDELVRKGQQQLVQKHATATWVSASLKAYAMARRVVS